MSKLRKKIVVVGDGGCGKTALLMVYQGEKFHDGYLPTTVENYIKETQIDDRYIELELWDTAGQEDYDRLRPLSYHDTDVVIICFSIAEVDTLKNVEERWKPEIEHFLPGVPIVLAGNKLDLRLPDGDDMIPTEDGKKMATVLNAVDFIECSAKTLQGVSNVFDVAVRAALKKKTRKKRRCILL